MIVIRDIVGISVITYKSMQGCGTMLWNHYHELWRLVLNINDKVGIVVNLLNAQHGAIDKAKHEISGLGKYTVTLDAVHGFMEELVLFVKGYLSAMGFRHIDALIQLTESSILGLVYGIISVIAEQTQYNEDYFGTAPDILPHKRFLVMFRNFSLFV